MAGDDAWYPCNRTKAALDARVKSGLLRPITDEGAPELIVPPVNDREPNPPPGYVVCFLSFLEQGFGTPVGRLIRAILHYYGVELHNLNPNSVMQAAVFATVCEGFLGIPLEPLAPPFQGGDVLPQRGRGEEAPMGWRLHAATPSVALPPVHPEHHAFVELGVAEQMVLPPE